MPVLCQRARAENAVYFRYVVVAPTADIYGGNHVLLHEKWCTAAVIWFWRSSSSTKGDEIDSQEFSSFHTVHVDLFLV